MHPAVSIILIALLLICLSILYIYDSIEDMVTFPNSLQSSASNKNVRSSTETFVKATSSVIKSLNNSAASLSKESISTSSGLDAIHKKVIVLDIENDMTCNIPIQIASNVGIVTDSSTYASLFHMLNSKYTEENKENPRYGRMNDHYCDCIGGGEDESATDACSYYTPEKPIMKCKPYIDSNSNYRQKIASATFPHGRGSAIRNSNYLLRGSDKKKEMAMIRGMPDRIDIAIFASRYRDGICDCHDCADEK